MALLFLSCIIAPMTLDEKFANLIDASFNNNNNNDNNNNNNDNNNTIIIIRLTSQSSF